LASYRHGSVSRRKPLDRGRRRTVSKPRTPSRSRHILCKRAGGRPAALLAPRLRPQHLSKHRRADLATPAAAIQHETGRSIPEQGPPNKTDACAFKLASRRRNYWNENRPAAHLFPSGSPQRSRRARRRTITPSPVRCSKLPPSRKTRTGGPARSGQPATVQTAKPVGLPLPVGEASEARTCKGSTFPSRRLPEPFHHHHYHFFHHRRKAKRWEGVTLPPCCQTNPKEEEESDARTGRVCVCVAQQV